jgi:hypothetical protein
MNTDQFAHFGLRLLELMTIEYHREIVKSEALQIVFGLLRTGDYETVVQCLSFVKVLLQTSIAESGVISSVSASGSANPSFQPMKISDILNKKLLILLMKTVLKS